MTALRRLLQRYSAPSIAATPPPAGVVTLRCASWDSLQPVFRLVELYHELGKTSAPSPEGEATRPPIAVSFVSR
jgi:hypothetical protein